MDTLTRETTSPSLDRVREIVARELAPLATRIDLDGLYPEEVMHHLGAAGADVTVGEVACRGSLGVDHAGASWRDVRRRPGR